MRVSGISFSSDRKLKRCELQYSYRYDEKLKPRIKSKGLFTGDWLHQLYQAHYLKQDWKKAFKKIKAEMWDKLFDEEKERYEEKGFTPEIAYSLMDHYVEHWAEQESAWKILHVEKDYEIVTKAGFPVRFKTDLIFQEKNRLVLLETKNKKEIPDPAERILEPQVHTYCYLLSKVGIKIDRILWNYIRTSPVPRPQILKNGGLSKRKINTDRRGYLLSLKEAGIHPKTEDERLGIENHLASLPETLSLDRVYNVPNLKVGEMFVRDWYQRAKRAMLITRPTRNWSADCKWDCDYMGLCQADMLGKPDRNAIIKKDFVTSIRPVEEEEGTK